ncbi:MAG TPA: GTPase Era [Armatimonadetes bacterium]|nr:GTPase Era [Armatimonadota bacterium]
MAYKSGRVALIGKPNAGKSTLLNQIVGQKVSIVSNKAQTTRKRVVGILTTDEFQIAFVDTPGVHEPHTRLGRAMVEAARTSLSDVDLIVFVADGSKRPDEDDAEIIRMVQSVPKPKQVPVLVCINKMDRLRPEHVQKTVDHYVNALGAVDFMLTTALDGTNVDKLVGQIVERLPEGPPLYDPDDFTDQSARFMAAELVREKILNATKQEVPHATAVVVEAWEEPEDPTGVLAISASIIVEKQSQKAILIGHQGRFIKTIGTKARQEIEELLGRKVYLELFVKVREGWRMNPRMLQELEYLD